jgi:hypothetical protein
MERKMPKITINDNNTFIRKPVAILNSGGSLVFPAKGSAIGCLEYDTGILQMFCESFERRVKGRSLTDVVIYEGDSVTIRY